MRRVVAAAAFCLAACARGDRHPAVVSVTPAWGGGAEQTFTLVYSAPNGFSDLTDVKVLFGTSTTAIDSCYIWYDPVHDALNLADDDGERWTAVSMRGSGAAENSECRITAAGSSATGKGTELRVRVAVTFKRAFAGKRIIYMSAEERQGLRTGLHKKGTWNVPYAERPGAS